MKKAKYMLTQVVERFLFALLADGRAQRTQNYYKNPLALFLQFALDQQWPAYIQDIDATRIRQFIAWAGTRTGAYQAGKGSQRRFEPRQSRGFSYFKSVRRLFTWAAEQHFITSNPVTAIHFRAPPAAQIQPYALEEIRAMFSVCGQLIHGPLHFIGLRNKALLVLFIDSALRLQEMGNINLSDLNLTEGYVRILGKGNKQDICPFSPKAAAILEEYLAARKTRSKTNKLWITENGYPLTPEGIRAWFRMMKSAAKVTSPGGVHRLRHTAALAYLRATRDPFLLQLFLRHNDLTMSRRYVQGLRKEDAIRAHHNGGSPVENLGIE